MDMSYATIQVFGGEQRRMYREVRLAYITSDLEHHDNHPIYVAKDNMGSCILQMDEVVEVGVENLDAFMNVNVENLNNKSWKNIF